MSTLRLHQLNLNHLLSLDALLAERSVTRAARRLGVSQSALSHTLASLRRELDDPLLVRSGSGLVPTVRAQGLAGPLRRALQDLEAAVQAPEAWDPATAERRFRLALPDSLTLTVLPGLLALARAEAPGIDLDVRPAVGPASPQLESGAVDASFQINPAPAPGIKSRLLLRDGFVCVVRADHPGVGGELDLDTYCALPHALMSPEGDGRGVVDAALAKVGRSRRVQLQIRYFLAAPLVVARSDLVLTAPRALAVRMAQLAPLRLLEPPLPTEEFAVHLVWHERFARDPGHRWFRDAVARAMKADLAESGYSERR